jgi:hypothetical protein
MKQTHFSKLNSYMSDEKPKKVRKSSPKKTAKQPENNNGIQEQDILNVKHLINELIEQRTQHVAALRNVQDVNTALVNTISEFLNCFMIIGFNDEGTPVAITKSNNYMEKDALQTLLQKFFTINMIKTQEGLMGEME